MFRRGFFPTVLLAPTRSILKVKCAECTRMLSTEHFVKSPNALLHRSRTIVCLGCKKQCEGCGARLGKDRFYRGGNIGAGGSLSRLRIAESSSHVGMCIRCTADMEKAKHNVYFRYPSLKYKETPLPIEKYRTSIVSGNTVTD